MGLKNYYDTLGVSIGEDNIDTIRYAYRSLCEQYHPDYYSGADCIEKTIDINEAFLVLSDSDLKRDYDAFLLAAESDEDNSQSNAQLLTIIEEKRQKAESFASSFFQEHSNFKNKEKRAKRNKMGAVIFIVLLFLIPFVVGIISVWPRSAKDVTMLGGFNAPSDWTECTVNDLFTFFVPSGMEIAFGDNRDDFAKLDESNNIIKLLSEEIVIFRFDSSTITDATGEEDDISYYSSYDGLVVSFYEDASGELLKYDETEEINSYNKDELDSEFKKYIAGDGPGSVFNSEYKWIDVDGTKVLKCTFKTNSLLQKSSLIMYAFENKNVVAFFYFPNEVGDGVSDIIRTFKWKRYY